MIGSVFSVGNWAPGLQTKVEKSLSRHGYQETGGKNWTETSQFLIGRCSFSEREAGEEQPRSISSPSGETF